MIRENDDEMMMDQELATIFCGINAGEIRLGAKKTRGFGEFKIVRLSEKVYSKENYLNMQIHIIQKNGKIATMNWKAGLRKRHGVRK